MIGFDAMMSRLRWSLLHLGVAVWLLVGIPACSKEAPPTDAATLAPADDVQAQPVDAEEARRQELLTRHAQEVATEEDRLRAEQGDADAQILLALVYYHGRGVETDREEGLRWARLAAEQGNARGQGLLAAAYHSGIGVEQDYIEAARWARLAAEQNNNTGQVVLGTLYMNGHGVEQDFVSAYVWLTIARDNGVAGGTRLLDFLTDRLTSEQLEEAQSRVRDWTRR